MPDKPFQEKTEPATPKRREEARKKGQVAKSREVISVAVLGAGAVFLFFGGETMVGALGNFIQKSILMIPSLKSSDQNLVDLIKNSTQEFFGIVWPMMLVLSVVAILANYVQIGVIWSVGPLAPKASKINPIEGAKRIFSKRSAVELGKSIAKVLIVGWAAFSILSDEFSHLSQLVYMEKNQIMGYLGDTAFRVIIRSFYVLAFLAFLDYIYQKWEFSEKMKMTKQEVKEEFKQTEGDPMVKSRIRSIQRDLARRRMMEEVKQADVVITNPTHLSIALRYDAISMTAPKLVAKGADKIAFRIRELAKEHKVPIVENKILAQNLYKTVDIGEEIPSDLYKAVAEILAYVYGLKRQEGR